jgi:ureidoacrylate peracid hydrolase
MAEKEMSLASLVAPRHTAVLVVDVQPFFVGPDLEPTVEEVLPRLRRLLDAARDVGVLRVFIRAEFHEERWTTVWEQQFGAKLGERLRPGSPLAAFQPGFEPEDGDPVVIKDCYSSFLRTNLEELLRSRGIETVIVTGLTTDVCVSSTARDAFQLDFHTVVLSDCCAEETRKRHESALETVASVFGRVVDSDHILSAWQVDAIAMKERSISKAFIG